jgi:RNA polymerase sigma-70 factor (ECF subfamily)
MSEPARIPLTVNEPDPPSATPTLVDERAVYERVLTAAMAHAERLLPRDQAFEVAHDVALAMLGRAPELVTGTLIYIAVTSRFRVMRRSSSRRAVHEGAYLAIREQTHPSWTQPGADLEAAELQLRVDDVVAGMPPAMRAVFQLVREEEMSYKEAASRLGVAVGTIHTQLSRANALLRECVERYADDRPEIRPRRDQR